MQQHFFYQENLNWKNKNPNNKVRHTDGKNSGERQTYVTLKKKGRGKKKKKRIYLKS